MKKTDLFHMCLQNLFRRKSRTFLTILGVLIGCCSIVIMVSIGIGMKESTDNMLSEMGDLTLITVSAPQGGASKVKVDDKLIQEIKLFQGVIAATPKKGLDDYTLTITAGAGDRYTIPWATVVAIDMTELEKMGYTVVTGALSHNAREVMVGQYFAYNFQDSFRPEGSNMIDRWSYVTYDDNWNPDYSNVPDPYVDPLKEKLTLEVSTGDETGPKASIVLQPTGSVKEDYSKGWETSEGLIMDISDLKGILQKLNVTREKIDAYDSAIVKVTDISMVEDVENKIKQLGYNTESMESIRKPMEKEARQKQLMLGGLGAISLFVAALGITNTMIMAISERTREIGIMKSLGCYVSDIRTMFLIEAGIIGFLGGVIGCIVSFVISIIIDVVSLGAFAPTNILIAIVGAPGVSRVSVIPPWLYLFAVVFSIFIGLGSGYYPANKAVKISALEAIKNDG